MVNNYLLFFETDYIWIEGKFKVQTEVKNSVKEYFILSCLVMMKSKMKEKQCK